MRVSQYRALIAHFWGSWRGVVLREAASDTGGCGHGCCSDGRVLVFQGMTGHTESGTLPDSKAGPVKSQVHTAQLVTADGGRSASLAKRDTEPFSMLGVTWTDPAARVASAVEVRTRSADSGRWSDWLALEVAVPTPVNLHKVRPGPNPPRAAKHPPSLPRTSRRPRPRRRATRRLFPAPRPSRRAPRRR